MPSKDRHIRIRQWQIGKPTKASIILITAHKRHSRYASHNDYVGFRKIVHDAHYPEDQPPPMPNASTWFPSESSQSSALENRGATAGNQPADDDDDLAVASERISIKCPITLLPMKDPVTSQKCPHSFEKAAILSMINASDVFVGGSGRRGVHDGQKAMKCPVCEVVSLLLPLHHFLALCDS